jgi:cysteinyl-tRNA synthetase
MHVKNVGLSEEDIRARLTARHEARRAKNWEMADTIRKELEAKGVILEDKKDRTDWKIKAG